MERTFEQQGYLWISNGRLMSKQKGVFRVNCIDCLDRTNVVQVGCVFATSRAMTDWPSFKSAFARHALNRELGAVALLNPVQQGRTEVDIVFNDSKCVLAQCFPSGFTYQTL
jgi:phosphatidylinositol 4-phosphatase